MAELMGLISSIVALVELTTKVTLESARFVQDVKSAPSAILALSKDAASLHSVLKRLESNLTDAKNANYHLQEAPIQELSSVLAECANTLQAVQSKLTKFKNPDLMDKVRFVFAERSIAKLHLTLEGHKSTLVVAWLADTILAYGSTGARTHANTEDIKESMAELSLAIRSGILKPDDAPVAHDHATTSDDHKMEARIQESEPENVEDETTTPAEGELDDMVETAVIKIQKYLARSETHQILDWTDRLPIIPPPPPPVPPVPPSLPRFSKEALERNAKSLITAAEAGNLKIVQILSKSVSTLDTVHPQLGTALQAAATNGHVDVVRELLSKGADPNLRDDYWRSESPAIALVARNGNEAIFQCLLEYGADPTPGLLPAVMIENVPFVKQLLAKGAKPKKAWKYREGYALSIAVARKRNDIALLLLDGGADPDIPGYGIIPTIAAVDNKNFDGLKLLRERKANLDQACVVSNYNALIAAVTARDEDAVRLLVELGVNMNALAYRGNLTALGQAIRLGFDDMFEILLSLGADSDFRGKLDICTPIQTAVGMNNIRVTKILVGKGADINYKSIVSPSALELAMKDDENEEMVMVLLGGGL